MIYRAAIIGCGKIGSEFADDPLITDIYTHAGAYVRCPDTELVAVCDQQKEKADRCKRRWNVPQGYTDLEKMLSEARPEIVSICTPDQTHYDIIRAALESSGVKAVFAEKPLSLHLKEAENLVALAEKSGTLLAVNYSRRYAEKFSELRNILHSGKLGKIQTVNGYYTKGTMHNGTHWFDLARMLIGEFARVYGFNNLMEKSNDPTYDMYAEFRNGAGGFLHACNSDSFTIFEMDIIGSKGRVCIKDSGHVIDTYTVTDSPHYSGYKSLHLEDTTTGIMNNALLHAVEDIAHCLKTGDTPLCSGTDGIAALNVALAVRSSVQSGKAIDMEP